MASATAGPQLMSDALRIWSSLSLDRKRAMLGAVLDHIVIRRARRNATGELDVNRVRRAGATRETRRSGAAARRRLCASGGILTLATLLATLGDRRPSRKAQC